MTKVVKPLRTPSSSHFHHTMKYPDGRIFMGEIDREVDANRLGITTLEGLRVLDIATNDGFFAFWAERLGASEVVAIDVGNYKDYDWGPDGPPDDYQELGQPDKWAVFDFHHKNLNSNVVKKQMSVYDIHSLGKFDVILNYGLVYHLRYPLMALDRCREACNGFMVIETSSSFIDRFLPVSIEMGEATGIGSITDTYLPTVSCLASWMWKSGFYNLLVCNGLYNDRSTLIGVVDEKYLSWFPNIERCDIEFWRKTREALSRFFPNQHPKTPPVAATEEDLVT